MSDTAGDVAVVALFAIGPLLLVMLTSFVKLSVVLSLVRNALGTPQVPPGLVVTGLSLVLTLFVMAPVIEQVVDAVAPPSPSPTPTLSPSPSPTLSPTPTPTPPPPPPPTPTPTPTPSPAPSGDPAAWADRAWPSSTAQWLGAAARAEAPVVAFLSRHAHARDRATFATLASRLRGGAPVADDRLVVLAPAFITSELKEAFAIGLLLLLPFLVIDLVVGMSLAALGLAQTSPSVVALPVKLLLFVAVDGWRLLVEGLVLGYA